jgi:arylsulfatase
VHAPHHVAPEWIDLFKGQFDEGWDALRSSIFERQLAMGAIPPETVLTERPEQVPSWDEYPDRYKPVASRLMEVFAGFMAHTDAQVEKVIDYLVDQGAFDNTLVIYLTGDNGASAEGTIHGAWSAPSFQNGVHEDPEWLLEHMEDFGTERCENHFNVGWAWALDSPFQWMKQVASHFGGTRNALAVSWPKGIGARDEFRQQFQHVIDVFPTLLEVAGIPMPGRVNGIEQDEVHGTSMVPTFADASTPSTHATQYFEILGNRAIYHDGWMASCFHGRLPWIRFAGFEFDGEQEVWELYHVAEDFSQSVDLAAKHPEKLRQLQELFEQEAERYGVYPLRDASGRRGGDYAPPHSLEGHSKMTYGPMHVRLPEHGVINLKNTSFRITGAVETGEASTGVIACQGGNMAGWSLYLDTESRPTYVYNWFGHEFTTITGSPLGPGKHRICVDYAHDGGFAAGGDLMLSVDGQSVATGRIERSVPVIFSMSGETFDVGRDTGSPVGKYPHDFAFSGSIQGVTLERLAEPTDEVKQQERRGKFQAGLSAQ